MAADEPVPRHRFGRCDFEVPALVWRVAARHRVETSVLDWVAARGADLVLLDADATLPGWDGGRWLLGVTVEEAQSREPRRLLALLDRLGPRVAGLVLQGATLGSIKAGRAIDRLTRLRERRGVPSGCIEASDDPLDAEWLIENTPAHGVLLRYDRREQSVAHRALRSANELGVAVLAVPRCSDELPEEVRFLIADRHVTSAVLALPSEAGRIDELLRACGAPMEDAERAGLWCAYRMTNPEPKRLRHGHVLDE